MARLPDPDRSRAVLIGTSAYTDPELPPLPAVTANLADLAAVLTAPDGTGLAADAVTVLGDEPDPATVGEALTRAGAEAADMLLVYYAGHGLTWTKRNELYLALRNSRVHSVGPSALRCTDVQEVFLDSAATTRVLVLDCCFSGRAIPGGMAGTSAADALVTEVDVEGAYILAATEGPRMALAPAGQRNTLFTGELLRLLRDGIPDGPPLLTLDRLYRELRATLRRRNLPLPSSNASASAAHLALAPNRAARTGDAQALLAGLAELDAVEAAADEAYRLADDRIADHGVTAPVCRYAGLRERAEAGETTLAGEIAAARSAAERTRAAAQAVLDQRTELRGRLNIYLTTAVRLGVSEQPGPADLQHRAHALLWSKPCDLRAAATAVQEYGRAVYGREEAG